MNLLRSEGGIIKFWLNRQDSHRYLARVALRILATPASSASSERDFSLWKLLHSPQRSRIDDETAESIALTKSSLSTS